MSSISRENEKYLRDAVANGEFDDRNAALDAAIALLRRSKPLIAHAEHGTKQLRQGEFREYNNRQLNDLRDRIKADGRARRTKDKRT